MEVNNSKNNQYVPLKYKLSTTNKTQIATVSRSENQDKVELTHTNGKIVTYNLKEISQSSKSSSMKENPFKKIQLGANHSWRNEQIVTSNIDMSKPVHEVRYEYGNFNTTDKIDEFLAMSDRLLPVQQEKLKYITPSQDWLNLASKLDDKQINQFTDIVYDMSESIFLNGGGSHEVDEIVNKFNTLSSKKLIDTIGTMFQLREKAGEYRLNDTKVNIDNHAYRNITESDVFSRANPLGLKIEEGEALLDYTKLVFSANGLSDEEISSINSTITDASYLVSRGVIDSFSNLEDEPRNSLFNLISSAEFSETESFFGYIGNITTKASFTSSYKVAYGDEQSDFVKISNPSLSQNEQKELIENILTVANNTSLSDVLNIMEKATLGADEIQASIWGNLAKEVTTPKLLLSSKYISALVKVSESSFISQQSDRIHSDFALTLKFLNPSITQISLMGQQAKHL